MSRGRSAKDALSSLNVKQPVEGKRECNERLNGFEKRGNIRGVRETSEHVVNRSQLHCGEAAGRSIYASLFKMPFYPDTLFRLQRVRSHEAPGSPVRPLLPDGRRARLVWPGQNGGVIVGPKLNHPHHVRHQRLRS